MAENIGKIVQIVGPVVDVSFEQEGSSLPSINDALEVTRPDGQVVVLECQQHIGEKTVRTIAMDATDGMSRGMDVKAEGKQITMLMGDEVPPRREFIEENATYATIDA